MLRHPLNANLHLYYEQSYAGMSIQSDKGPFIREYLDSLIMTIRNALNEYSRVFAFRVDLRLPAYGSLPYDVYTNAVIGRFLDSFKAKIKHNREMARRANGYAHDSRVRFVWVREIASSGQPHYHLLILLNQDAFYTLGKIGSENDNMRSRLDEAWASALGVSVRDVSGLVEVPENPVYRVHRDNSKSLLALFFRASYLCKAATKSYGGAQHAFGCSRG
jgi:hypothetical protein